MSDLISRADAIEAVAQQWLFEASAESPYVNDDDIDDYRKLAEELLSDIPSAEAVQNYTEWLEKIIVDAETFEWLCEDTNDKEWCEDNCHYSSIQAECLRHLYEADNGGADAEAVQGEWKRVETRTYKGECTNCGFRHIFMDGHDSQYRFCPNCGARMKGGDTE